MWPSTRSTRAALWRRLQEEFRSCSLAKKIEARSPCGPSRQTFTAEPEWYWRRIRQECLNHSAPAVEVAARAEVLAARVAVAEDAGALEERAALEVLEERAALGGRVARAAREEPGPREQAEPAAKAALAPPGPGEPRDARVESRIRITTTTCLRSRDRSFRNFLHPH